jgi:hypothetical protein
MDLIADFPCVDLVRMSAACLSAFRYCCHPLLWIISSPLYMICLGDWRLDFLRSHSVKFKRRFYLAPFFFFFKIFFPSGAFFCLLEVGRLGIGRLGFHDESFFFGDWEEL